MWAIGTLLVACQAPPEVGEPEPPPGAEPEHTDPPGAAPEAEITSPVDGSEVDAGEPIELAGLLTDTDDRAADLVAWWTSSEDGALSGEAAPDADGRIAVVAALGPGAHVLTLHVRDPSGLTGRDELDVRAAADDNTAPTLVVEAPSADAALRAGEPASLVAVAADAEDDPTALVVTWRSDRDGDLPGPAPDASGRVALAVSMSPGPHLLTVTVTDRGGLQASEAIPLVMDEAPSAPTVSVSPDPARTTDELVVSIDADSVDPEGDPVTYAWSWAVDGAPTGLGADGRIGSSSTARGEVWTVTATPHDAVGPGPAASASAAIENSPPSVAWIALEPADATTDSVLVASAAGTDPDVDPVSLQRTWSVDGAVVPVLGSSLDGAVWFDRGQEVRIEIVGDDGLEASEPLIASWTVQNSPPTTPAVDVVPRDPSPADDLVCAVDWLSTDADGDPIQYRGGWARDGVPWAGPTATTVAPGDTIAAASTVGGETWTCSLTPSDGLDDGGTATSSVRVGCASAAFGPRIRVSDSADGAQWVRTADLDGDGDTDVLSANSRADQIAWFENRGASFGPLQVVANGIDGPWSVIAADLDGDGDPDVVSGSEADNMVAWFENRGGGNFGPTIPLTTAALGQRTVEAADLDGDGDLDLLATPFDIDQVTWLENLGGGTFAPMQVVATGLDGAIAVFAADLDGDGDQDVVTGSYLDNRVAVVENRGGAGFGPPITLTTSANGVESVHAADLDGDGDLDVLSASKNDNVVAWYENRGPAGFGPLQPVDAAAPGAVTVWAEDLDQDGDPDVIAGHSDAEVVAWYENLGGGFGPAQVLYSGAYQVWSVYADDVDGDGDPDVLSASYGDDEVSWFENACI